MAQGCVGSSDGLSAGGAASVIRRCGSAGEVTEGGSGGDACAGAGAAGDGVGTAVRRGLGDAEGEAAVWTLWRLLGGLLEGWGGVVVNSALPVAAHGDCRCDERLAGRGDAAWGGSWWGFGGCGEFGSGGVDSLLEFLHLSY